MVDMESESVLIDDELEIIDLIRSIHAGKEKLWLWQKVSDKERMVHLATIRKVDLIEKKFSIGPLSDNGFDFKFGGDIFLCSKERNIASKITPVKITNNAILLPIPDQIRSLSKALITELPIVEVDNEEGNIKDRQFKRSKAKDHQFAIVKKLNEEQQEGRKYLVHDISVGGIGLITNEPGEFKTKQKLQIISINYRTPPNPIIGEVLSVRHVEEENFFKVGVQFVMEKEAA